MLHDPRCSDRLRGRPSSGIAAVAVAAILLLAARPAGALCTGDCDGDGQVVVAELITAVGIALGAQPAAQCAPADASADGRVDIAELIAAVGVAVRGCPVEGSPTATVSPQLATVTATAIAVATPTATAIATAPSTAAASATPTASDTATPSATPTSTTSSVNQDPPTRGRALRDWLEAGNYLGWAAESASHASTGPHFGAVRVFVNDRLLDSLQQGLAAHPAGAATVKELFGSGDEVRGWSVMVKVEDDSDGGAGWYWYERYNDTEFANGRGVRLCTGCHAAGQDFIRIPFPLQ